MLRSSSLRRKSNGPGPKQRQTLVERSSGDCEMRLYGCFGRATEAAHRIKRGAGGRHGEALEENNRLSNLLHACRSCHAWTHASPNEAYDLGLMLREHQDPSQEPVAYQNAGWVLLDDLGGLWPYGAED